MLNNTADNNETCKHCADIVERSDVPHVVRICKHCGQKMRIVEPGERGKGIQIRAGDSFVIPSGWLTFSFNPLESTGQFFKSGLDWFAKHVFIDGLINKDIDYEEAANVLN